MKRVIIAIFWISSSSLLILTTEIKRTLYASRDSATWLVGLDICSESHENGSLPGSMASFMYYNDSPNDSKDNLFRQLNGGSGWLYGLEGIFSTGQANFLVSASKPGKHQRVACQTTEGGVYFPDTTSNHQDGNKTCENNSNGTFFCLESTKTIHWSLQSKGLFRTSFWVGSVDENKLIYDNYSEVSVKCLLLDESGKLKSDNCFEKHRVICATEVLEPTLKYVNISTKTEPYDAPTPAPTEPPTTVAETTGTSPQVDTTTDIFRSITSSHVTTVSVTTMLTDTGVSEKETIIIGSVGVVVGVVGIVLCCWACRRKSKISGGEPKLSEVYSDTADSVIIRRVSCQDNQDAEYATPEDALKSKKAIQRSSANSDTYDALNEPLKHKGSSKEHVNVYSHVAIVQNDVAIDSENTYDVTTYSKKSVPQTTDQHETYGTVGIKIS